MNTTEVPTVELVFRPARSHEAHTLICERGACSQELLKNWTNEFQPFFDKHYRDKTEKMMQFTTGDAGIPTSYRVQFKKDSRDTTARLVSMPSSSSPHGDSKKSIAVAESAKGLQPAQTPSPTGWRADMLGELDRFIEIYCQNDTDRNCLKFASDRLRDMAANCPEHFTLTVFSAFIAAAHTETMRRSNLVENHLFQAAAAVLQRAQTDSDPIENPVTIHSAGGSFVWRPLTWLIQRCLPDR